MYMYIIIYTGIIMHMCVHVYAYVYMYMYMQFNYEKPISNSYLPVIRVFRDRQVQVHVKE